MPLNQPDLRQLNIDIVKHGKVRLDANWACENAKNYFTRLYLIKEGCGWLQCGEEVIHMQAGNVYLIPSEFDFGYGCEALDKIFFHILLPFGEKTDILSKIGKVLILDDCEQVIDTLYDLYGNNDVSTLFQTKTLVYTLLAQFIDRFELVFSDNRKFSKLTTDALGYIWDHIAVNLSVKQIAAQLYVSESKLRNTFRREVKTTIGAYIDDAVFFTARKLLSAEYSIDETANALGFCDRNYLSRRFKEKLGKTISQYRQELLG